MTDKLKDIQDAREAFTKDCKSGFTLQYGEGVTETIQTALELAEKIAKPVAAKTMIKRIEFDGQKLVVLSEEFYEHLTEALDNDR